MPSQWYRRTAEGERGPFSFDELAEFLCAGTLGTDEFVRRGEQTQWQRVSDVVGLLRAAGQRNQQAARCIAAGAARSTPSSDASAEQFQPVAKIPVSESSAPTDAVTKRSPWTAEIGARGIAATVIVMTAFVLLVVGVWHWRAEAARFPMPATVQRQPPAEYVFLGWGPLSLFEYLIVWADAIAVVAFPAYLLVRRFLSHANRKETSRVV